MHNNVIISKFLVTRYDINDKLWKSEYVYYYGDFSNLNLKEDWRFKEIPNKRKELLFVELVNKPNNWKF